jgi:glycosyltransferase involved in cell wall biosynthesis
VAKVAPPDRTGEQYLRALGLPERFILYAGSLDARKNVDAVLTAVERLHSAGRRPTLVLMGQAWFGSGPSERRIAELRSDGVDVRPLGFLPAPLFYEVMKRAAVFAFPSRYEGFGLPPLEAMFLGVPTVVGRAGSLPEVCGDGARYVDPEDPDELAQTLAELLASEPSRRALAEAGRARARTFTWERAAKQTLDVYSEAQSTAPTAAATA